VFNSNIPLFNKILEAIKLLNDKSLKIDFFITDFVISAGNGIAKLKTKDMPNNIHLVKSVPQLEVLKRANLFVTHSGMNSMMETIYFGVPTICLPLAADQPLVANRATNDLDIGVYVDFVNMKPISLTNAIKEVLDDESFYYRAYKYSQESREHNGKLNGSEEIFNLLRSQKELIKKF